MTRLINFSQYANTVDQRVALEGALVELCRLPNVCHLTIASLEGQIVTLAEEEWDYANATDSRYTPRRKIPTDQRTWKRGNAK